MAVPFIYSDWDSAIMFPFLSFRWLWYETQTTTHKTLGFCVYTLSTICSSDGAFPFSANVEVCLSLTIFGKEKYFRWDFTPLNLNLIPTHTQCIKYFHFPRYGFSTPSTPLSGYLMPLEILKSLNIPLLLLLLLFYFLSVNLNSSFILFVRLINFSLLFLSQLLSPHYLAEWIWNATFFRMLPCCCAGWGICWIYEKKGFVYDTFPVTYQVLWKLIEIAIECVTSLWDYSFFNFRLGFPIQRL